MTGPASVRPARAADAAAVAAVYRPHVEQGVASFELAAPDGQELLRRMRAHHAALTGLGLATAYAGIVLPNPGSVALHEAVGFTPVGVFRAVGHKAGAWHDVGWWQRPLAALGDDPPEPRRWTLPA